MGDLPETDCSTQDLCSLHYRASMEKKWKCLKKDPPWILCIFTILFFCVAGSPHPHTTTGCEDKPPQDYAGLQKINATPATLTPEAIHKKITCPTTSPNSTATINANETYNATENAPDATNLPFYTSPNSTDNNVPSNPTCLQGWAIFLIFLSALLAMVLLAGLPVMLWYVFHRRHLQAQQPRARYNHNVYVAPEEQSLPLE